MEIKLTDAEIKKMEEMDNIEFLHVRDKQTTVRRY